MKLSGSVIVYLFHRSWYKKVEFLIKNFWRVYFVNEKCVFHLGHLGKECLDRRGKNWPGHMVECLLGTCGTDLLSTGGNF